MKNTSRLVFLVGSGISIAAGLPSTKQLTEAVFAGDNYEGNCGDESFSICSFLCLLREMVKEHFQELNRPSNYEDLYYVCSQITGHHSGNFDNPVVVPFVQQLWTHLRSRYPTASEKNLYELTAESLRHIANIVIRELRKSPSNLDHLSFIYDAYLNQRYSTIDIFTLNHDCLVETYLRSKGVDFVDGFGEPARRVRYWDPGVFQNKDSKISFFKLHGSLDWYRLRPDGAGLEQEAIGISLDGDPSHALNKDGRLLLAMDGSPQILIGTFNKMLEYTGGVFLDLLWQFRYRLRLTTHLVVCGYGFADKGINTQLAEWVYSNAANRMCVIHPQPDDLRNSARGAIRNKWEDWEKNRTLIVVPKRAECVTFAEICETFVHKTAS